MKLKKLLKDIPIKQVKGPKDAEITGICVNSKLVAPGNLFIAKKGRSDDGSHYIPEAISAGASAILTDMYDPSLKDITQLIHPDVTAMEGLFAANYYQFASDSLFMVGITGTNGKTTTSFLVKHLLDNLHGPCGLIGTIEYIIGQQRYQATRTTPDVSTNHKMLREMVNHECRSAVMEVTSHALDQGRVQHIEFDVAVFTNLTVDHLDYHQTMDSYCIAKNKLFSTLKNDKTNRKKNAKTAVVNADSLWHTKMLENCHAQVLTYGIESNADLRATDIHMTGNGTELKLHYKGQVLTCHSPLVGRFNVYNVLAATGVAISKGASLQQIVPLISSFSSVAGRLETVRNELGLKIYVDFAHSDDALTNVLECLHEIKAGGKIITVFGCGGDRDQTKRPRMAQAAEALSDVCIVTTDNPRSEDPSEIIRQIVKGFKSKDRYVIELDRHAAISKAIDMASPNDLILLAGKGHEPYQVFSHKIIEFDDRKVAAQICKQKHSQCLVGAK
ncbi:MAG: UDP-N-acetylmuramoyl-L-alanyl-D-glutamate--2,6-diaminopimelate ligase [Parachlamydiaceae bacterium]|nr:UDP-N-acetylmuramoyl-L-alanyl-D-glutamate--2,6-diaminopimelate ligase [Parachlamydiaceae bacterium]